MNNQGPGKISLTDREVSPQPDPNEMTVKIEVHLHNFDIDVASPLKDEHKKFLDEKIIPALAANKEAKYTLLGSASRSGPEAHNLTLSTQRAEEVQRYLDSKVVGSQINPFSTPKGLGAPAVGAIEDEHHRAVFISMTLPIKLDDLNLKTDDWSRNYKADDLIGLLGTDKRSINKLNIEVEVSGAPRIWEWGNLSTAIMPTSFPLMAKGTRQDKIIVRNFWDIPIAESRFQPNDPFRAVYHLSGSVAEMGFSINRAPCYAGVFGRDDGLSLYTSGWDDLGFLAESSRGPDVRSNALRLLQAGGYEYIGLSFRKKQKMEDYYYLLRSPADVFYYSGSSASPAFLLENWKSQSDMKVLIVGLAPALAMDVRNGVALGGSGAEWAKLLGAKGGPLTAILGYRNAPLPALQQDIVGNMGRAMAKGLPDDQWAQVWLRNNIAGAVAMDRNGYWWVEERSLYQRSKDFVPFVSGDKYEIKGPAAIV